LLKVGLGIDCTTESTHRGFELAVAVRVQQRLELN
jgi:hypothetical protein